MPKKNKNKHGLSDYEVLFSEMIVGSFRNSHIENIHAGKPVKSKTGDFSDVKVVTPYGEIEWNKVSFISDEDMGKIKDDFRENIHFYISMLKKMGVEIKFEENSKLVEVLNKEIMPNKHRLYAFKNS